MSMPAHDQSPQITKIREHIGAEVTGIDLSQPVDEETRQRLYDALVDNIALVIRDQNFTAAQFQAAGELFGELMEDQNRRYLAPGVPMVSILSNHHKDSQGKQAKVANSATWHTDHTNQALPPKFTSLYPVALPDRGGGTALCNMRAAYEALPDDLRQRIDGMQTANTLISSARTDTANPDIVQDQQEADGGPMIHPLVRTHPERGTKAIWFHQGKTERILDMEPGETQEFLAALLEVAMRPEFTYTHEYRLGDMLILDNRSAMHKAGFDYDHSQHRMLYRLLVRGERPF
ncbi:MAG: TauD/TfdA family dioxygenase [Rhodospirillaceae bacterium]|jgi:alpha-ketoglutarate-dependent taurine dioxygenase|nr:TauD/TfdA family dioxygenase [Rhodospirillaceae bacterium]MBT6429901.1 TauD/TfdA family dioxygenase [Rhodospirillaceae bacterium]